MKRMTRTAFRKFGPIIIGLLASWIVVIQIYPHFSLDSISKRTSEIAKMDLLERVRNKVQFKNLLVQSSDEAGNKKTIFRKKLEPQANNNMAIETFNQAEKKIDVQAPKEHEIKPDNLPINPNIQNQNQPPQVKNDKKPTLVVMGTAKNCAKRLSGSLATIKRMVKYFDLTAVIVYENDSTDSSLAILNSWQASIDVPVHVISEKRITGGRTYALARGRNAVFARMRTMSPLPEYVLMLDLDGVNDGLEEKGVASCLDVLPPGWGACCVNQRGGYFDLWALRTYDDWCNCDVWFDCRDSIKKHQRRLDVNGPPIKVKSCFGGAALYNIKTISPNATYTGSKNGHQQCEHVGFSETLGAPLYIHPGMLNG